MTDQPFRRNLSFLPDLWQTLASVAGWCCLLLFLSGCATPISVDRVDAQTAYGIQIQSALSSGQPSEASKMVLRRQGLMDRYAKEPGSVLAELHRSLNPRDDIDRLFTLAELSFLQGQRTGDRAYYLASAVYAWALLFPGDSASARLPPTDARLRLVYDLYNQAIAFGFGSGKDGEVRLAPGVFPLPFGRLTVSLDPSGLEWGGYQLGHLMPTNTLEVDGLRNRYHRLGLGAPLAASLMPDITRKVVGSDRLGPHIKVPITVLLRLEKARASLSSGHIQGRIEVYAADQTATVTVEGETQPLDSDPTAALAYQLDASPLYAMEISNFLGGGMLQRIMPRNRTQDGLYTLHPYRKGRIPLVLVHGTASSPARWAELINELEGDRRISERYQIWFFTYETGNPVGVSAGRLRSALSKAVQEFDPKGEDSALRRMVVAGHSQGGLLTKLTAIDSGTRFWDSVSSKPLEQLKVDQNTRDVLRQRAFFTPLPFVQRVIFVATPHHGALLASGYIGALAAKLVTLPFNVVGAIAQAVTLTGDEKLIAKLKNPPTAVDNMNPENPQLRILASIPVPRSIPAHSIIAVKGSGPKEEGDDGVVAYRSAHIDEAVSEKVVRWNHSCQDQPEVIEEIRRILLLHATEADEAKR